MASQTQTCREVKLATRSYYTLYNGAKVGHVALLSIFDLHFLILFRLIYSFMRNTTSSLGVQHDTSILVRTLVLRHVNTRLLVGRDDSYHAWATSWHGLFNPIHFSCPLRPLQIQVVRAQYHPGSTEPKGSQVVKPTLKLEYIGRLNVDAREEESHGGDFPAESVPHSVAGGTESNASATMMETT